MLKILLQINVHLVAEHVFFIYVYRTTWIRRPGVSVFCSENFMYWLPCQNNIRLSIVSQWLNSVYIGINVFYREK
jgi:hypothetical protein